MSKKQPVLKSWPVETPEDRVGLIYEMARKSIADPGMQKLARRIVNGRAPGFDGAFVRPRDEAGEVDAVFKFIKQNLPYRGDTRYFDTYMACYHALDLAGNGAASGGDCFPLDQKVIVRNRGTRFYEIQRLGDLRHAWMQYDALSYDFAKSAWAFKPITAWTYRGERETVDAKLSNGARFSCTPDHEFWSCRWRGGNQSWRLDVAERPITDLLSPGSGDRNPMILAARQIPVLAATDVDAASAYIKGIYAAEGFTDPKHVRIAQDKVPIREKIEAAFAEVGGVLRPSKRKKHAYYDVKGAAMRAELRSLGSNSFDMQPAWDCLSGNTEAVRGYMEGHFDGDGGCVPRKGRGNSFNQYSTSSEDLADGLRLGLFLGGRRQWWYKQEKHGGVGDKPIYRVYEHLSPESKRATIVSAEFPGLRTVSVKSVVPGESRPVCDISVADTHNFVLADGTVVHNCDDHTGCLVALLWILGFATGAKIIGDEHQYTHIYAIVGLPRVRPTRWVPLDTTVPKANVGWEPPKRARKRERKFLFARDGVYELQK
jgi:hypothetical protein